MLPDKVPAAAVMVIGGGTVEVHTVNGASGGENGSGASVAGDTASDRISDSEISEGAHRSEGGSQNISAKGSGVKD